ncbi:MAG TPA: CapA family protein [bacterium]|nr:CapA family protein [bacterium]HNW09677.1 CapA family protein [bacterium]HNZ73203.1 CapA family protein [bacterium]HOH67681.1 CapA family protein [bacterium]HPN81730.1 CapA family protein [bacterium]
MMKRPAIYLYFFSIIAVVTIISGALFLIGNNFSKDKDNLILSDQSNELFDSEPASGNLPEPEMATTTMVFGGDVMLSRNVGQKMEKYNNWQWPFEDIAPLTTAADLAVINLESPFTIGGSHLVLTGSFSFKADPQAVAGLNLAGIDIVSLANNHILNQGAKGISDTQKTLTDNSIDFIGAGLDEQAARHPVIREINQIKFGFLAYAYPDDYSVAATATPGIANLNIDKMQLEVDQLKAQADVVIVLMHAGIEYKKLPNFEQQQFARAAIDAGADLIVGHHPHWVQSVEIYQGKPILYSLGNLIFDQMWSQETREGALAKIIWRGTDIEKIEIIPVIIEDYARPRLADSAGEAGRIFQRMGLESSIIDLTPALSAE